MNVHKIDRPIDTAPTNGDIIWVKGSNQEVFVTLAYFSHHEWKSTADGQALVGVTHWAPMS